MDGFLAQVAADLYDRYGDGVSSLSVVFPSRRASLFFGEALSAIVSRPLWQPRSVTIDSLAEELSGLSTGNRLRLVVELYKTYSEFHPAENFDTFYFWGELLLGDFDSIDKYLIDADTLFSNLVDLHELDDRFDYLSTEQRAVIEKFWGTFRSPEFSPEQRDFLTVWRTLAPVYHSFRERLQKLGIAYEGMVYRRAAERILEGRAPQILERHYVIAGFNALSKCEQVIFDYLKQNFEVDFYWDHDTYYTGDEPPAKAQEAGRFMRDDLRRFPPAAPLRGGHDNFAKPKRIRSVAAAGDVLQCKWAGLRLRELAAETGKAPGETGKTPGKETAVVLCDESLLTPLLWSVPPEIESLNITMGYPLRMHPSYTFVERLVELQNRRRKSKGSNSVAFYHSDVDGLLRHPYLADKPRDPSPWIWIGAARLHTTPLFETIFSSPGDVAENEWRSLSAWLLNVISQVASSGRVPDTDIPLLALCSDHIRTLSASLEASGVGLSTKTYASLLRRSLQSATVPFEGEPLEGVQIMGFLETRALDFENIIFLSSGDANLPGNLTGAPSFIPYNLKMAFGLPTPEHHEGVWAYHFFRLIQRARRVDMVWSSTVDDRSAGEPSRYLLQLDYESPHEIEKTSVSVDVDLSPEEAVAVEKSADVMRRLEEFLLPGPQSDPSADQQSDPATDPQHDPNTDPHKGPCPNSKHRRLSPSLLFTHTECPLKFYFRAVAGLKADEELSEEVDNALFGSILHRAMQILYTPLVGIFRPQTKIRALIGSAGVENAVARAATELSTREEHPADEEHGGSMILARKTVEDYLNRAVLPFDASRPEDYTIEKLEEWVEGEFTFPLAPAAETRIGTTETAETRTAQDQTRTVGFHGKIDRMDRLGDGTLTVIDYKTGSPKNNSSALLQTALYRMMLERINPDVEIRPVLYWVRDMSRKDYTPPPVLQPEDFEETLCATLAGIFDPSIPFIRCPDPKPCTWCEFNAICRR